MNLDGASLREAVCGGVSLYVHPGGYIGECAATMLSYRGRAFTYDASADGFMRGEGVGCVYLRSSAEAEDQAARLAVVLGSCSNQDGRSASLTAPHGPSQQECVRTCLRDAAKYARDVQISECHGTGTALGDPIEIGAQKGVFAVKDRLVPVLTTSAKSNIGHMEACAGMGGLCKVVTMLRTSCANGNVHLRSLNPHLDVKGYPVFFETELTDSGSSAGIVGVSSFGFGGTNSRAECYGSAAFGHRRVECFNVLEKVTYNKQMLHAAKALLGETANQIEAVLEEQDVEKLVKGKVCIRGSWDAWTSMIPMRVVEADGSDTTFVAEVPLGEHLCEQFHLCVNDNEYEDLRPDRAMADQSARVLGPVVTGQQENWLLDLRGQGLNAGAVARVTFTVGQSKRVSWEPIRELQDESQDAVALGHRPFGHHYHIVGTMTGWSTKRMDAGKNATWEVAFRIGHSGLEEFRILRDSDASQALYPGAAWAVCGPDRLGEGHVWQVRGRQGDVATARLTVADGQVTVEVHSPAAGWRKWRSDGPRAISAHDSRPALHA